MALIRLDDSNYPGLTVWTLDGALRADENTLQNLRYDAEIGGLFSGDGATTQLRQTREKNTLRRGDDWSVRALR